MHSRLTPKPYWHIRLVSVVPTAGYSVYVRSNITSLPLLPTKSLKDPLYLQRPYGQVWRPHNPYRKSRNSGKRGGQPYEAKLLSRSQHTHGVPKVKHDATTRDTEAELTAARSNSGERLSQNNNSSAQDEKNCSRHRTAGTRRPLSRGRSIRHPQTPVTSAQWS